jgi:hypothetical protein
VYSLTSIQGRETQLFYQNSCKTEKNYPGMGSVLPNKRWCTVPQGAVYSLTSFGVLPSKKQCTLRQILVYSPTSFGVLLSKWYQAFLLQMEKV